MLDSDHTVAHEKAELAATTGDTMPGNRNEKIWLLSRLWQATGGFLSKIAGAIVLAFVFYAVMTPIGLMLRALGKDPLRLRRNKSAVSYWIKRAPPGLTRGALKDQF